MSQSIHPSGNELFFDESEIIVTKTNPKGNITYANDVFIRLSGYHEEELLGAQHSIVRHPEMPRAIFKLLWETIQTKEEIFAYVKNMSRNGDYYWVFAHVTPSYSVDGDITSFHSNRRVPNRKILEKTIEPLYKSLLEEEKKHNNKKTGLEKSYEKLMEVLEQKGKNYDEFILSL